MATSADKLVPNGLLDGSSTTFLAASTANAEDAHGTEEKMNIDAYGTCGMRQYASETPTRGSESIVGFGGMSRLVLGWYLD